MIKKNWNLKLEEFYRLKQKDIELFYNRNSDI